MEKITKKDGKFYYGDRLCRNADEAYLIFRENYHQSLGKQFYYRLDRLGERKERVHGFGFYFNWRCQPNGTEFCKCRSVRYRILGLVGISYSRIFGAWDLTNVPDDRYDAWFDWAFCHSNRKIALFAEPMQDKAGRTSSRLNKRYR